MFRSDCFDMSVKINDRNIILSNEKTKEDIEKYISSLSQFYKIQPITIEKDNLDIDSLSNKQLCKSYLLKTKISLIKKNILYCR